MKPYLRAIAALLVAILHLLPGTAGGEQSAAPAEDRIARSVVKIRAVSDVSRRLATGSGVIVADGKVVTSCHGTRNSRAVDALSRGKDWQITQQWNDLQHDLCLLQVDPAIGPAIELAAARAPLRIDEMVHAVGFLGPDIHASRGSVRGLYLHDGALVIQTDAKFGTGESGGALVNERGQLVGVLTFFTQGSRNYYFAVPVDWVHALLRRSVAVDDAHAPQTRSFWEAEEAELPFFLRAAAREHFEDWLGLEQTAAAWTAAEASNPQAWIALGKARQRRQCAAAAVEALRRAVELDADHATAWYYLGVASQQVQDQAGVARALERLDAISPTGAQALRSGAVLDW